MIYYDRAVLDDASVRALAEEVNTIRGGAFPRPNVVFTPLPEENESGAAIYATAWRHLISIARLDEDGRSALAQFVARDPAGFYERFPLEDAPRQEALSSAE